MKLYRNLDRKNLFKFKTIHFVLNEYYIDFFESKLRFIGLPTEEVSLVKEKVLSSVLNGYLPKEVHFFKENLFCLRKKEILNEKKYAKKLNCHLQYFMVLKRKRMVY
jgi:hypothetical protein